MSTMVSIFFLVLGFFIKDLKADDGIDVNVFKQHDNQIKFERLELVRFNKDIFKNVSIVTFKYNRTTAAINASITTKIDLVNGSSIVQAYKFMSNEYRHFPLRFAVSSCKALSANVAGIGSFRKCGNVIGCPFLKGVKYEICNWFPDPSQLPPLIPNGQYKIEIQLMYISQELAVVNAYGTVSRPIV